MAESTKDAVDDDTEVTLVIKWNGKEYPIRIAQQDTLGGIKRKLEDETCVNEKKQKIIGLKTMAGKMPTDDTQISELSLKPKQRIMMLGSIDAELKKIADQEEIAPHFQDHTDEDDDETGPEEGSEQVLLSRPEIQEKLARRVKAAVIKEINPPRKGKKCAVLDIDYTFFDLSSPAEVPNELVRPYLHEFLESIHPYYDIVIWSATSMKWIDVKLKELGLLDNPTYKITACMDYTAMVTVAVPGYHKNVFDCKPLHVLWSRYPEYYSKSNTIMLDDLRRNYVLNRGNGLVIKPFRKSATKGKSDREMLKLKIYFDKLLGLESFEGINHDDWEHYIRNEWKEFKRNL